MFSGESVGLEVLGWMQSLSSLWLDFLFFFLLLSILPMSHRPNRLSDEIILSSATSDTTLNTLALSFVSIFLPWTEKRCHSIARTAPGCTALLKTLIIQSLSVQRAI